MGMGYKEKIGIIWCRMCRQDSNEYMVLRIEPYPIAIPNTQYPLPVVDKRKMEGEKTENNYYLCRLNLILWQ